MDLHWCSSVSGHCCVFHVSLFCYEAEIACGTHAHPSHSSTTTSPIDERAQPCCFPFRKEALTSSKDFVFHRESEWEFDEFYMAIRIPRCASGFQEKPTPQSPCLRPCSLTAVANPIPPQKRRTGASRLLLLRTVPDRPFCRSAFPTPCARRCPSA
jgi:hypothetical protein